MKNFLFVILCILGLNFSVNAAPNYSSIDRYAKEAPVLKNSTNLERLVHYLVRPYKTDEEKARVLLAWIVYNIDYDGYKLNVIEGNINGSKRRNRELFIPDNDILETRLGVCGDIAELYKRMGNIADLSVVLIYGRVKEPEDTLASFESGPGHVWTAVKINNQWEYVDPTFAIDGQTPSILNDVETTRSYQRIVKQRAKRKSSVKKARDGRVVNNKWFLTDKDEMIKTHFPDDEQWQLQEKKLTKQEFLGLDKRAYRAALRQQRKRRSKKEESK